MWCLFAQGPWVAYNTFFFRLTYEDFLAYVAQRGEEEEDRTTGLTDEDQSCGEDEDLYYNEPHLGSPVASNTTPPRSKVLLLSFAFLLAKVSLQFAFPHLEN